MSDRYEKIRQALEMGPTPGPFSASRSYSPGNQELILRLTYKDEHGITENYCTVRNRLGDTWKTEANAAYIAACDPDTIRALLTECDALRARVQELEIEREAQRSCAIYWMDQENALRASMLEALELLVGDKYQAVEHNPEDGARCFYCGGPLKVLWHEDSYLEHEMDCDFVKARAVLARVKGDAE